MQKCWELHANPIYTNFCLFSAIADFTQLESFLYFDFHFFKEVKVQKSCNYSRMSAGASVNASVSLPVPAVVIFPISLSS